MKEKLYIGTYSEGANGGLFWGEFDSETGKIELKGNYGISNPSYFLVESDFIVGVSETLEFDNEVGGGLFIMNKKTKEVMNTLPTYGRLPCHLAANQKHIFVANYLEGIISIYNCNGYPEVEPVRLTFNHYGHSVNPTRQEAPHPHCAVFAPDGGYLAVCDLGLDQVLFYPYSLDNGLSSAAPRVDLTPGYGPRHLTFSKDGKYMYVVGEMGNTLSTFRYSGGRAELLGEVSTLPGDFLGESTVAAVHLSPDGTQIGVSNRGHDSIAIFDIGNHEDAMPFAPIFVDTGKNPRDFSFSPDGKWLLVANQNCDCLQVFGLVDGAWKLENSVQLPSPVCVKFDAL